MLVGLGGNNGSSVVAGVLANKMCVPPRSPDQPDYLSNAHTFEQLPCTVVARGAAEAELCVRSRSALCVRPDPHTRISRIHCIMHLYPSVHMEAVSVTCSH
jgi:hypothetical protein